MKVKSAKNKISPEGDLIFENAEKGKEVFLSALDKIDSSKAVIIDLSKVDEIDSSGFQLLLAFIRTLQNRDIEFNIRKIRAEVFELVKLTGLNKFFRIQSADVIAN
jgi:anti-anti-sigma factor